MFGGHSRVWPLRTFKLVLPWDTLAHPWVERRVSGPVSVASAPGRYFLRNSRESNPLSALASDTVRVFTGYSSGHGQE